MQVIDCLESKSSGHTCSYGNVNCDDQDGVGGQRISGGGVLVKTVGVCAGGGGVGASGGLCDDGTGEGSDVVRRGTDGCPGTF